MAELYGVHDELPAEIADVVLDDNKPDDVDTSTADGGDE